MRGTMVWQVRRRARLATRRVAVGLVMAACGGIAAGAGANNRMCSGAVQHPVAVHIQPLDPIRRGATVRLDVRVSAHMPLRDAEVRLVSPGGAGVEGERRLALGRLSPERERRATFRLAVPREGQRFLVQFTIAGEGAAGTVTRGAVYNLLPDGPTDPGRLVTTSDGRRVLEFASERSGR